MTARPVSADRAAGLVRADAALNHVVGLLNLVSQEEAALRQVSEAVALLDAIHHARQTLLGVTDTELAEARSALGPEPRPEVGSAVAPGVQSGQGARFRS